MHMLEGHMFVGVYSKSKYVPTDEQLRTHLKGAHDQRHSVADPAPLEGASWVTVGGSGDQRHLEGDGLGTSGRGSPGHGVDIAMASNVH